MYRLRAQEGRKLESKSRVSEVRWRHLKLKTEGFPRTSTEFQDRTPRAAPENGWTCQESCCTKLRGTAEPHCAVGKLREELG